MDVKYKTVLFRRYVLTKVCNSGCNSTEGYFLKRQLTRKAALLLFLNLAIQQACNAHFVRGSPSNSGSLYFFQ